MPPGPDMPSPDPSSPPTTSTPDLADLLEACAAGDHEAFPRLYDATVPRVYGLVLRVLRDDAQAQEVTQEVFLEVWRTCTRYQKERGSALGWLLTLAHRRAVDRVRSADAQSKRDVAYEVREKLIPFDSTAEGAQRNLEAERVRQALTELSEVQREALQLAYFGGLTHREVASRLDLPVGTAKTRIRDGLMRLRSMLGEEGASDGR